MREIKFELVGRNKATGEIWRESYTLEQLRDGREILTFFAIDNDNCELLAERQYTGLKDKNGVEIYEGGIIRSCQIETEWQEETGDNIPGGYYRHPVDVIAKWVLGEVVMHNGIWIYSEPDDIDGSNLWDTGLAVSGIFSQVYDRESICDIYFVTPDWKPQQEPTVEAFKEAQADISGRLGLDAMPEEEFIAAINGLEVVGNIYENPELATPHQLSKEKKTN